MRGCTSINPRSSLPQALPWPAPCRAASWSMSLLLCLPTSRMPPQSRWSPQHKRDIKVLGSTWGGHRAGSRAGRRVLWGEPEGTRVAWSEEQEAERRPHSTLQPLRKGSRGSCRDLLLGTKDRMCRKSPTLWQFPIELSHFRRIRLVYQFSTQLGETALKHISFWLSGFHIEKHRAWQRVAASQMLINHFYSDENEMMKVISHITAWKSKLRSMIKVSNGRKQQRTKSLEKNRVGNTNKSSMQNSLLSSQSLYHRETNKRLWQTSREVSAGCSDICFQTPSSYLEQPWSHFSWNGSAGTWGHFGDQCLAQCSLPSWWSCALGQHTEWLWCCP